MSQQEKFTKDEFVKQCVSRGYVGKDHGGRSGALGWCKRHPKEYYTEEDLLTLYRYFNSLKIGDRMDAYIRDRERTTNDI